MSKITIPITEVRKNIFKITEEVQKPNTYYTLTVEGKPQAVLLSYDEFDSIMETMEIMSDPQVRKNIAQAEEEYRRGEYVTLDELKKDLRRNDFAAMSVRDAPKSTYKASKRRGIKSKK